MAVNEYDVLMRYKDSSDNTTLLYPITKKDNVDGIDEFVRNQSITTSGSGSAYTATVEGITSLSAGISFVMVPHVASVSSSPTLNVNNLGAIRIRRRVTNSTGTTSSGGSDEWLSAGKPIRVEYDGTFWIADLPRPNATDLMGAVPVANGGTGATTAAAARANIGAVTVTGCVVTLSTSSWSSNTQTVSVDGLKDTDVVIPGPASASYLAYGESAVRCTAQQTGSLTFTCTDVPSEDLTVNVLIITQ